MVAHIQIAGSTSAKADNWLWAWANSNLPGDLLSDAKLVRSFGEEKGIDELAQAYVLDVADDLEALGWGLTGAMVRICKRSEPIAHPEGKAGACT